MNIHHTDIDSGLIASDDEIARLVAAFRAIPAMQQRMRLLDMAERFAVPVSLPAMASPVQREPASQQMQRMQQSLFQGNQQ